MTTTENSHIDPTDAPPVPDENAPQSAPATAVSADADTPGSSNAGAARRDDADNVSAAVATAEQPTDGTQPVPEGEVSVEVQEPAVERPAPVADEVLLSSADVARAALLEVTAAETIGELVGHAAEDAHVLSLFFDSKLRGYPGWHWTVTLSRVGDDGDVTVLETELMPGENALLAPEWVPWSERLADYQAGQEMAESEARALAEAAAILDESDHEDGEDDEDVFSILHAGDVDGVDVDEIDADVDDAGDVDSDDDDDDDDDADDESDDDSDDESDDDDDDDDDESDDDDDDDDDESDDDDDDDDDESDDDHSEGSERSY